MFLLNEKVVYPGHGVARISRIIQKNVGGAVMTFYELTLLSKNMTALVPVDRLIEVGIRKISSSERVQGILNLLSEPHTTSHAQVMPNWSKKSKVYLGGIRTGNLEEIGKIYRELIFISAQKDLSFGEKNLLQKTEDMLVEEIAAVNETTEEKAREQLRLIVRQNKAVGHMKMF